MTEQRYPSDLIVTIQDFEECGWEDVLATTKREGYSSMWQAYSTAARQAIEEGKLSQGKVLWLLADACSMTLVPESKNVPFRPIFVIEGKRSVIPDDLPDDDIGFFAQIVDKIDDPWLKARLADLLWLKLTPRDVNLALTAIDAYWEIPLDTETWIRDGDKCWERAISLTLMLREGAGDRLEKIESALVAVLNTATIDNGFLGNWLADLLYEYRLGHDEQANIAKKLESLARVFDDAGDIHRAREYFDSAAKWYQKSGDETKAAEMTVAIAEGWVKEAVARISTEQPSYMVAATFYESAIQTYRRIPRSERASYRVDGRIDELRAHLNDAGERSLDEMGTIKTPSIDISEIIDNARKSVRGKDVKEALLAFVNLSGKIDVNDMRDKALENIRNHPLHAIFAATVVSRDGRVIAKRPGMGVGEILSDDEIVIRSEMIRDYSIRVSLVVQGDILSALNILQLEHRLSERDFTGLAKQSPIVPPGREQLFGKGLYSGFDYDFITAIHVLIPQIEHLVRFHLKQAGVKTTNIDANGIENENGLSALMELPETNVIFGKDLTFELRTLFCDAFGPNLRNELAHGLLDDEMCQSIYSIYAWWFSLKLVFNTFWNAARRGVDGDSEERQENPLNSDDVSNDAEDNDSNRSDHGDRQS